MKKVVFGAVVLSMANLAWAACLNLPFRCGPATRYDVRVTEVALCSDAACSSSYVVGSGAKTFDIASATAGSALGSYAKVDAVPNGVYTHIRVVFDRTFVLAGPIPAGSFCVAALPATAIAIPNDGSVDLGAIQMSWHDAAKTQVTGTKQLPTPLVMTKGTKRPSVMVKFDTQEGLMCTGGGAYMPGLPAITLSVY